MQAVIRLYREARRRKVFRTAALYVLGAWAALQVAALMFPGFGIPEAAIRALIWAAVLGLPVAVVFGWLFEIGPGGIRRTAPLGAGETVEPRALGRSDYLILAAFAAIAVVLVYRAAQDIRETPKDGTAPMRSKRQREGAARLPNSIAVLPFTNISNDPDNEYFCDGISEEILDRLSRAAGLNVIGRTSSFAFKGSDYGIERISALLGVRYVLQGSVRKAGDQLRVSAQLLDAGGVQVWSESFDRQLENVFEIQSEIAGAVANTVASQVVPETDVGHEPDLDAYEHYLTGRTLLHRRDSYRAREELQRAVEIDPQFAEAHAELAIAQALEEIPGAMDRARASVQRALQLKPRLLRARAAEGFLLMNGDPRDPAGAERVLREVLDQDPNMSDALNWLQGAVQEQGRDDEARAILERAALIDPLHPSIVANLAGALYEAGEVDRAMRLLERQLEQPRPGFMVYGTLSWHLPGQRPPGRGQCAGKTGSIVRRQRARFYFGAELRLAGGLCVGRGVERARVARVSRFAGAPDHGDRDADRAGSIRERGATDARAVRESPRPARRNSREFAVDFWRTPGARRRIQRRDRVPRAARRSWIARRDLHG